MTVADEKLPGWLFGLGSGRSGTVSLAEWLNRLPNTTITHEGGPVTRGRRLLENTEIRTPVLPWVRDEHAFKHMMDQLSKLPGKVRGDVSFYLLPYVEDIVDWCNGNVRLICLKRNKFDTVNSFVEKTRGRHHWTRHDGSRWGLDPGWDQCFPDYDYESRYECIEAYWEDYYREAERLHSVIPQFGLFDIEVLNSRTGHEMLRDFILSEAGCVPTQNTAQKNLVDPVQIAMVLVVEEGDLVEDIEAAISVLTRLAQKLRGSYCTVNLVDFSIRGLAQSIDKKRVKNNSWVPLGQVSRARARNIGYRSVQNQGSRQVLFLGTTESRDPFFVDYIVRNDARTDEAVCVSYQAGEEQTCCLFSSETFERLRGYDEALNTDLVAEADIKRRSKRIARVVESRITPAIGNSNIDPADTAGDLKHVERKRASGVIENWEVWGESGLNTDEWLPRYVRPVLKSQARLYQPGQEDWMLELHGKRMRLSVSAAEILKLCRGRLKVEDIVQILREATDEPVETLIIDVQMVLTSCLSAGMIRLRAGR